jgi:hypothetical protein
MEKILLNCDFKELNTNTNGQICLSLVVRNPQTINVDKLLTEITLCQQGTKNGLKIEIDKMYKKRSVDANAYFHLLCDKLSKKLNLGTDEVKRQMVLDYGAIDTDDNGLKIGFKLLTSIPIDKVCEYGKIIDVVTENEKQFNKIIVYKKTRDLDSKEMAHLIDGVVEECKNVGIETMTPNQLAELKSLWSKNEERQKRN